MLDQGFPEFDAADHDIVLKSASRPRFLESTGMKIRPFIDDCELCLSLCNRPRLRLGVFVLGWLGIAESDKVRRSHFADSLVDDDKFRDGLITLFGIHECEDSY